MSNPSGPESRQDIPQDVLQLAQYMRDALLEGIPVGDTSEFDGTETRVTPTLVLAAAAIELSGDGDVSPFLSPRDWLELARSSVKDLFESQKLQGKVLDRLADLEMSREVDEEHFDVELYRELHRDAHEDGTIKSQRIPISVPLLLEFCKDSPGDEQPQVERELLVRAAKAGSIWLHVMRDRGRGVFGRETTERFAGQIVGIGTFVGGKNNYIEDELRVGSTLAIATIGNQGLESTSYDKLFLDDELILSQVYFKDSHELPLFPTLDLT